MCASVYWSCVRRLSLSHALRSYLRRKTGLQRSCSSICQAWHRSKLEVLWTSWTQCQLTTLRRRLTETSLQRCVPLAISLTSLYSLMTDNSQMTIFVYLCELPNTFDTSFLVAVISEWGFYELLTLISVLPNQLSAQVLALSNTNLIESRHVTYVADKFVVCGVQDEPLSKLNPEAEIFVPSTDHEDEPCEKKWRWVACPGGCHWDCDCIETMRLSLLALTLVTTVIVIIIFIIISWKILQTGVTLSEKNFKCRRHTGVALSDNN